MYKYLILALIFLSACATPKYQLNSGCSINKETFFEKTANVLSENGFTINSDYHTGLIKAFKRGFGYDYAWNIQYIDGAVVAFCKRIKKNLPADYLNKDIDREYIEVRNKLENICGDKFRVMEVARDFND